MNKCFFIQIDHNTVAHTEMTFDPVMKMGGDDVILKNMNPISLYLHQRHKDIWTHLHKAS